LEYVEKVWRRPVILHTVDSHGTELAVTAPAALKTG
jgi:hypothetical protein